MHIKVTIDPSLFIFRVIRVNFDFVRATRVVVRVIRVSYSQIWTP